MCTGSLGQQMSRMDPSIARSLEVRGGRGVREPGSHEFCLRVCRKHRKHGIQGIPCTTAFRLNSRTLHDIDLDFQRSRVSLVESAHLDTMAGA